MPQQLKDHSLKRNDSVGSVMRKRLAPITAPFLALAKLLLQ